MSRCLTSNQKDSFSGDERESGPVSGLCCVPGKVQPKPGDHEVSFVADISAFLISRIQKITLEFTADCDLIDLIRSTWPVSWDPMHRIVSPVRKQCASNVEAMKARGRRKPFIIVIIIRTYLGIRISHQDRQPLLDCIVHRKSPSPLHRNSPLVCYTSL